MNTFLANPTATRMSFAICALMTLSVVANANAQAIITPIPVIAIFPQNDKFTFEIARVVHSALSGKSNPGFELMDQSHVEGLVMHPCLCVGWSNYPSEEHTDSLPGFDRVQGAIMLRSSVYLALVADTAGGEWFVDLRMRDVRKVGTERSLGRLRFTNTREIGQHFAKLITTDTAFVRLTSAKQ